MTARIALLSISLLVACGGVDADGRITQSQAESLHDGMTKAEVRSALGEPAGATGTGKDVHYLYFVGPEDVATLSIEFRDGKVVAATHRIVPANARRVAGR